MKNSFLLSALFIVPALGVQAGGLDRSGQSISPIFETGNYVELSFGTVNPSVTGSSLVLGASGDVAKSYTQLSGAIKTDLSERLSFALIFDQPFGADIAYPVSESYPLAGATASVNSSAFTAILRYKMNDNFSLFYGVRNLRSEGSVKYVTNGVPTYSLETSTENDWGYLIGAAYEIPETALRASLTYNSEIDVEYDAYEVSYLGANTSKMDVTIPQSLNFEFQTGIAPETLLVFSARWAEWTETAIGPNDYVSVMKTNLVDHDHDTISYSFGIGHQFTEKLAGMISVGYEKSYGGTQGNLAPFDGYKSVSAGVKYQINEATSVTVGASYIAIGDATTSLLGYDTNFEKSDAVALGLKLAHHF